MSQPTKQALHLPGILSCLLLLSNCSTIAWNDLDGEHQYLFGLARIEVPSAESRILVHKTQLFGVSWSEDMKLGWSESEQVTVPLSHSSAGSNGSNVPCTIVVVIRSFTEAKNAAAVLSALNGENICIKHFY